LGYGRLVDHHADNFAWSEWVTYRRPANADPEDRAPKTENVLEDLGGDLKSFVESVCSWAATKKPGLHLKVKAIQGDFLRKFKSLEANDPEPITLCNDDTLLARMDHSMRPLQLGIGILA